MLGLLPGWGGTQNLPALVGFKEAVPMILMGKEVRPDKAKKIGLVDLVVDPHALETVAVRGGLSGRTAFFLLWGGLRSHGVAYRRHGLICQQQRPRAL